jgi:hypothetical protein
MQAYVPCQLKLGALKDLTRSLLSLHEVCIHKRNVFKGGRVHQSDSTNRISVKFNIVTFLWRVTIGGVLE